MDASVLSPSEYLFMKWMAENHPTLLAAAEEHVANTNHLGDVSTSISNVLNAINSGLQTYVQTAQQAKLIQTNIARASAGQPPLTSTGQVYAAPVPASVKPAFPGNVPTWVWIAGGAALVWMLTQHRGRA